MTYYVSSGTLNSTNSTHFAAKRQLHKSKPEVHSSAATLLLIVDRNNWDSLAAVYKSI